MKILFCPAHYYLTAQAGSELSWAYNIVHRLGNQFPESIAVTGRNEGEDKPRYRIKEVMNQVSRTPSTLDALKFNRLYVAAGKELLKDEKFDLLHHVLPFRLDVTFNPLIASRRRSTPAVIGPIQNPLEYKDTDYAQHFSAGGSKAINALQSLSAPVLSGLSKQTLRSADRVVVINARAKNMVLERGVAPEQIVEIPPGIDLKRFSTPSKAALSKNKKPRFITAGFLINRKGVDLIVEAAHLLQRQGLDFEITILGSGPQEASLKDFVKAKKLTEKVLFLGQVSQSEMAQEYKRSDVFILMSRSESWGQVYLEAMASGLPVITTKNYGSETILRSEDKTGFLVDQEDAGGLVDRMKQFINKPELVTEMSIQARKVVERRYDWENSVIPQYQKLYEELLRKA